MGMSYELADAHVADMAASVWTLTRATFTGAAILLRDKAAYRDTAFSLRGHKSGRSHESGCPVQASLGRDSRHKSRTPHLTAAHTPLNCHSEP
jgi:hypothetical protein